MVSKRDVQILDRLGEYATNFEVINDSSFIEINGSDTVELKIGDFESLLEEKISKEIAQYFKIDSLDTTDWKITFNKDYLKKEQSLFFYSAESCAKWLNSENGFNSNSLISEFEKTTIFIFGLKKSYLGPKLIIYPTNESYKDNNIGENESLPILPDNDQIKKVSFVIQSDLNIEPNKFLLSDYPTSILGEVLLKSFIKSLTYCISKEVKSNGAIVIEGIKKVEFKIDEIELGFKELNELSRSLVEVISWIFEERTQTRLKLISK